MSFGENLQAVRKRKGLSQEELAEILAVSRQAVSRWEMNEGYPETEKLIALSAALDVSLDHLLLDKAPPEEPSANQAAPVNGTGRIMVHSAHTQAAASCYKFTCDKILLPSKKEPKFALSGVDGHGFLGDSHVLLGWYVDEESVQKEIREIMSAMERGEFFYLLQYDVKVRSRGLNIEVAEG